MKTEKHATSLVWFAAVVTYVWLGGEPDVMTVAGVTVLVLVSNTLEQMLAEMRKPRT